VREEKGMHGIFAASRIMLLAGLSILGASGSAPDRDTQLVIRSPLQGERFVVHETVTLQVSVKDRHADASQLIWTSSISGVLGKGPEVKISGLPAGDHTISASLNGHTESVTIREFKDLWDLYRVAPSLAELGRVRKDFSLNWIDSPQADEKWQSYDPPTFDQTSLAPSKVVLLANLDLLRHQIFSEPLPFGGGSSAYEYLRKYVKEFNLQLGCSDSAGGGGKIFLGRWQNTWSLPRRDCKSLVASGPLAGYVDPLALLMHEERHSEPGDSTHAVCYGFNNMDPSLDKGSGHAWATLYTMWVYKYGVYDPPVMRQRARLFAYGALSRFCSKPQSANPRVQAILDELLGQKSGDTAASRLPAPKLLVPVEGAVLHDVSKPLVLSWGPVPSAAAYLLEWDYGWSSQGALVWWSEQPERIPQPELAKEWWFGSHHRSLSEIPTTETSYNLSFVGAQPGRWRVWAVDADDNPGIKSEWREFRYTRDSQPPQPVH
jgi:hypothetical protein